MKLYEINQAIADLIDPETGEVTDFGAFMELQMDRDEKLENIALYIKDLTAEAAAIKAEEKALADRRTVTENKAKRLKEFLDNVLMGSGMKTPRVVVSYRKTSRVEVLPQFTEWAEKNAEDLLTYSAPRPSLTAIKAAINDGKEIPFASIVDSKSMSIK